MEVAEMTSVKKTLQRAGVTALSLAAMMAATKTLAAGTPSGTSVGNLATVEYEVGGIAQPSIESSPAGNSTPGVGAGEATTFIVDNKVDLTVFESGGAATTIGPGVTDAVTAFIVRNTGNTVQDYALTAVNLTSADAAVHGNADTDLDVSNLRVRVDGNGNGTYEPASDTATFIASLTPDVDLTVFVLADVPIGAADAGVANIRLTAVTHVAGSGAANPVVETAGADTAGVDVVFADGGNDGLEADDDGYQVASASLLITKDTTLVSDPFNGATDAKAIPGAVIEYAVTVANNGSQPADGLRVTDVLTPELSLLTGEFNGGAADVQIEVGAGPATTLYCTADGGDGDGDGCGLNGATLEVSPAGLTVGTTVADNPVTVRFRATIN
jgi:uncharacterized repeat protein (TIGR01451 family)